MLTVIHCAQLSNKCKVVYRGTVIGILKAFLGLSASAYVTLYVSFLDPDATAFVLMLAILPALLCLLCASFINYVRMRSLLCISPIQYVEPRAASKPNGRVCGCPSKMHAQPAQRVFASTLAAWPALMQGSRAACLALPANAGMLNSMP